MKVLCPSCERLVELVDLRVERGNLVARCPACGAEQRQQLPARPVTVPSPKAAAKEAVKKKDSGKTDSGKKKNAARRAPEPVEEEDENDEGPTIILLTPTSEAVPLAVAPPGVADIARPAEVARFESPRPPAIAPVVPAASEAAPPRRVVDAEFAQLLNHLGDVHPQSPPPPQAPPPQALRPRNTGANAVVPAPQPGVVRGSTIQIPPGHCPKCIAPRSRETLICPACGLVFANFRAEEHQPSAALESAWRGLEERWGRAEEHEKFLQLAFNMDELAKAGRLYRIRLVATPDDAQAKAALESMVRMASTAAAAAAKTDPAEFARNRRKVLAVSAMLFFVIPIAALLVNFLLRAH
jgi:uncharacterized Zn finger protein (UPF0148 family)